VSSPQQFNFSGISGYIIHPDLPTTEENHIAIGHTAAVPPWSDGVTHCHHYSEELFILLSGKLYFLIQESLITLNAYELLLIRAEIPHAIIGGKGLIEHIGARAPVLDDKLILEPLPDLGSIPQRETERELKEDWGFRISLDNPANKNCWLIGHGTAEYSSRNLILAYLKFPSQREENDGIGTRHRLHCHEKSSEIYIVKQGHISLQIESQKVSINAGELLAIPPGVCHGLVHRTAPFEGFTLRAPTLVDDKVDCPDKNR
jgi:mannose-6-phosphate isomerase-like protein (cupin superfamily)